MPAQKRKLESFFEVASPEPPAQRDQLEQLTHEELLDHAVALELKVAKLTEELSAAKQASKRLATQQPLGSNGNALAPAQEWSEEKIAESTAKIAGMMAKEIKKQMKWQPSCKRGTTKWSHTCVIPNTRVMYRILGMEEDPKGKAWKQKKIAVGDFQRTVGSIHASCRYNDLRITSDNVHVKWDEEAKMLTVSGTYGI